MKNFIWQLLYDLLSSKIFFRFILGLSRLTNLKRGDFYGPASSWTAKKKRQLGIHLIFKAMKIYMIEGERQIRQKDLTK